MEAIKTYILGKTSIRRWILAGLIAFAILGFLVVAAAISVLIITPPIEPRNRFKMTKLVLAETKQAIDKFYRDCKRLPKSSDELLATPPPECNQTQPYLAHPLVDGWKKPIIFNVIGNSIVLTSMGADGKEGGAPGKDADIVETWSPPQ